MSDRAYTTVDKTAWPRGEWDHEPDKIQWVDETTGLDCLIVRNGAGGNLCGYVGVPPGHPWHGVGYSDHLKVECDAEWCWTDGHRPDATVEVHGGLTYSDPCQESADPARGICHVPEPGRPDDVWWFGFDCAHAWDLSPGYQRYLGMPPMGDETYKPVAYVRREVETLARQLAEVSS
jgi:hypothetical protein